jgi:hypothetical protein
MTDHAKNDDLRADDPFAAQDNEATVQEDAELDDASMAAIRNLLADQEPAPSAPAATLTAPARKITAAAHQPAPTPQPEAPTQPRAARHQLPPIAAVEEDMAPSRPARAGFVSKHLARLTAPAVARVRGYRPTPKHVILMALGLLVFFRPWLVVGIVLLSLMIFTGVFLILGYDGFWKRGMAIARWYARRSPDRAAAMQVRLDRFAMQWDAVLDRFPEGTVDGLYLPDFQELEAAEARHEAALERRLKDMRETEV